MTPRRNRSTRVPALAVALAAAFAAFALPPTAAQAAKLHGGLDCGTYLAQANPPMPDTYSGAALAGPYVVSGTNAVLRCEIRRDTRTGPVLEAWSSPAGTPSNVVPQFTGSISFPAPSLASLFLCSTLTWVDGVNGPQVASGCEPIGGVGFANDTGGAPAYWSLSKAQDTDFDDMPPV